MDKDRLEGTNIWRCRGPNGANRYEYRRLLPVIFENGKRSYRDIRRRLGTNLAGAIAGAKRLDAQCDGLLRGEKTLANTTLGEFADWYIGYIRDERRMLGWATVRGNVRAFVKHAGARLMVGAVSRLHIEEFLNARRRNVRPATVYGSLRDVKRMFNVGVQKGYLTDNPAAGMRVEKGLGAEPRLPKPEEVQKLLEYLKARNSNLHGIVLALVYTGARLGEIISLDWSRVNIPEGTLTLVRRKVHDELTLEIARPLREHLESLWNAAGLPIRGTVFLNRNGEPHTRWRLYGRFKLSANRLGMPWLTLNTFRKFAATMVQEETGNTRDAQMMLGHTDLRTTEQYLGRRRESRTRAVRALEARLGGKVGNFVGNSPKSAEAVE